MHLDRDVLHNYWRNPKDLNRAENYIKPVERSRYLHEHLKEYGGVDATILEVGCNVGRNLNYLCQAGYNNLSGVEISPAAVELLTKTYPELASKATIYNASIEDIIPKFKDNQFDIVYTMAVLEHIHTQSEWIFREIQRVTKSYLITIEDEIGLTERHFPRNYKQVFEPLGFKQVTQEAENCKKIVGGCFVLRVFQKIR